MIRYYRMMEKANKRFIVVHNEAVSRKAAEEIFVAMRPAFDAQYKPLQSTAPVAQSDRATASEAVG